MNAKMYINFIRQFCMALYNKSPEEIFDAVYGKTSEDYKTEKCNLIDNHPVYWILNLDNDKIEKLCQFVIDTYK